MPCPFCEIDSKKSRVIAEKSSCYIMLSNPRLMPGHLLVIPRRHVLKPSELDAHERKEIFDTVIAYQEKIITKYAPGCDIRQNYRPFLKESDVKVDHVHFHLMPREMKDDMYFKSQLPLNELFSPLTEAERQKFEEIYG